MSFVENENKQKQTRDCLRQNVHFKLWIICFCVIILKIVLFLRFFPGALFLKNFLLLWHCFKLIWRMDKILCAPTSPWSPNREQNQSSKLLKIKQKWTSTYLILTYILLTSTIREVRRSVRRISLLILGLQRLRSLWLKHFYIRIHTVLCRHTLQM